MKRGDIVIIKDDVIKIRKLHGWTATIGLDERLCKLIGKPLKIIEYYKDNNFIVYEQFNIPISALYTLKEYRALKIKEIFDEKW